MAKQPKSIYAPGELDKVRQNLGELDKDEAKKMADILGGEIGWERSSDEEEDLRRPKTRNEVVDVHVKGSGSNFLKGQPKHRIELAPDNEIDEKYVNLKKIVVDPNDDPSVPIKLVYRERVKMDRYAAQPEFEIKNSAQVFYSVLSIFAEVPDNVNPDFINRRMKDIYRKIEVLVTTLRAMFPRNNLQRNEKLKRLSGFAFSVLDTLRYWNIERISADLTKIQARPRNTKISDFADILKAIYRPLFILDKLDVEEHIKGTCKLLYKILYLENPTTESKNKYQEMIRKVLSAYVMIRRDVHYILYPMLLKLLSERWMTYDDFFTLRKNRFMNFINAVEADQIIPVSLQDLMKEDSTETSAASEEKIDDEEEKEKERKKIAAEMEAKALNRGQNILESLFPKAGWDRISLFPDLYSYFREVLAFPKGYELVAPTDPMQQIIVLMRILEELFFGLRYVSFGTASAPDGSVVRLDEIIGKIVNDWHSYIEESFDKTYIPRLVECCRILDNSADEVSSYTKQLLNEMHLLKRFCFLPYYQFTPLSPPTIYKKNFKPIFSEIRTLRRYLTIVAVNIEQARKNGGAAENVSCNGIDNPWEPYNFQVPNPLSTRIDALLGLKGAGQKNNAALIFFTLSVTVVLDHIMNSEQSWAYKEQVGSLFRSVNGEGEVPVLGISNVIDAETIFRDSIKKRERKENQDQQEDD
jgi:hypothetical protein